MSSELHVLGRHLDRISEQHRWSRDFTASSLHLALGEVIACFPVYRTYAQADSISISDGDRLHILRAVREAKRRNRTTSESIFDFLCDLLLLRDPEGLSQPERADRRDLVMRLQQLTGPVMAKGLEDTVFYRYYPLASLNEVGGRPTTGTTEIERFHVFCARRLERWPHALSATATHDTKRGEDTRARLDVLSEIPREWLEAVRRWQRMNRRAKPLVDEARVPGTNEEYLLYQTLLGVWPLEALERELSEAEHRALEERVGAYLVKALREAKLHTSWVNVNEPYEKACSEFLRHLLDRDATGQPIPGRIAAVPAPGGHSGDLQLSRAGRLEDHGARRSGPLPGDRAVGFRAGRPGQPPSRRLPRAPEAPHGARRLARPGAARARRGGARPPGRRHAQAAGDDARPRPPASASRALPAGRLSSRWSPRAPGRATSSPSRASPATEAPPSP